MKVKYELSSQMLAALSIDNYSKESKYSTTDLLKSVQSVILYNRYKEKIKELEDPFGNLWRVFGSAVHSVLEDIEGTEFINEGRLSVLDGLLSGQPDAYNYETKTLYDFKVTSVWSVVYGSSFQDWHIQNSINAYIYNKNGFPVDKVVNQLLLRDWNKGDFERGRYDIKNPLPLIDHGVPLEEIEGKKIETWIIDKIKEIEKWQSKEDSELPECSEEFRWAEPDIYKIYDKSSKAVTPRSKKNCNTKAEALEYVKYLKTKTPKKDYEIKLVMGDKFKRCGYCSSRFFCKQYKEK